MSTRQILLSVLLSTFASIAVGAAFELWREKRDARFRGVIPQGVVPGADVV